MPYKISGSISEDAKIIIVNQSDWSVETTSDESVGEYEISTLIGGTKAVIARKSDGCSLGYGNVAAQPYSGDRGIFGGGTISTPSDINVIDYITFSSLANADDFGDMYHARTKRGAVSNGGMDRGAFGCGELSGSPSKAAEYITITTLGNGTFIGDMTVSRGAVAACSNGTYNRGIFGAGWDISSVYYNILDYITITSIGDGSDFGDLTIARWGPGGTSNATNNRGVFAGGRNSSNASINVIDYITISSIGNGQDFGDLTTIKDYSAGISNGINDRGVFGGGYSTGSGANTNIIDYITISNTSNSTNFGDLSNARRALTAASSGPNNKGVFVGGYTSTYSNRMDYIIISTLADATDFGDLTSPRYSPAGTSNA